ARVGQNDLHTRLPSDVFLLRDCPDTWRKQKAHSITRGPFVEFTVGRGRSLFPFDLRDGDDLLAVLLADLAGDGPLFGGLADRAVIGLVGLGIEVVDDVLVTILDFDDRGALGLQA